jgi:O-antigen/teichoic acid export membrane protein
VNATQQSDVLVSAEAGGLAVRGGILRVGGYLVGIGLALGAMPLLTRHLGVGDFGRYITVLSLIAIVGLISDAGLTVVGVREYALRDREGRIRLVRNLVGLRALVALVGTTGATVFAVVVGYSESMVLGTALAGIGLVIGVTQRAYTVPLEAGLRLGLVTAFDLLRQVLTVLAIVTLVAVGGRLVEFLSIPVPVGLVVLAAMAGTMRGRVIVRPSFDREEWRYLTQEALPVAIASTIGSFFYRAAIIMMSLLATAEQTGYFSASFRIIEAIIMVPGLLVAAAFPIAARAAHDDQERLSKTLQRLFDMAVVLGAWTAVGVVLGAGPVIHLVGGHAFDPAEPVLRVQGIALASSYLVAVWAAGLWALREQRALAWANIVGVGTAVGLTAALIPRAGAIGAAVAMTIAEALLATMYAFVLMRRRPHVRPSLRVVPKSLAAATPALALWFTPLPDFVNVLLATAVYYLLLVALRGIPADVMKALRSGWRLPRRAW